MVKRLYIEAKLVKPSISNGAHAYLTLRDEGNMEDTTHLASANAEVIRGGPEKFEDVYGIPLYEAIGAGLGTLFGHHCEGSRRRHFR